MRWMCLKANYPKRQIAYIRDTYGDALEYLWQKFPDNAVVRRKDNRKWYAVLLTVSRRRLGFDSDERVEIIDLRMPPEEIEKQVDGVRLLPGYHMNKKHWVTVCLDGSVSFAEICRKIDEATVSQRNNAGRKARMTGNRLQQLAFCVLAVRFRSF